MKPASIHPLRLGVSTAYLVRGEGTMLVDAGVAGKQDSFKRQLAALGVAPEEIGLILLTHGHWDHVGSAAAIQALTGAKLAIHRHDVAWMEAGHSRMPVAWTRWAAMFQSMLQSLYIPTLPEAPAPSADLLLDDDGLSLADYGVPGRLIHTPGHTRGSMSVLLDSGEALVGDLALCVFPLCLHPRLTLYGDDRDQLRESWSRLLDQGARMIYPAHGKPFEPADLRDPG